MKLSVTTTMTEARTKMTDEAFQRAASALSEAKNNVREELQQKTSSEIRQIIDKVQSNKPISPKEIDLIKAWIVGDASGYSKMENNFQDWLSEYKRLEEALSTCEKQDCTPDDLMKIHGTLEDAIRVSYDIANFLETQDRIKKFEAAVSDGLDDNERDLLVRVLIGKLESPKY